MNKYKQKISEIYRKISSLNLYVSVCDAKRERILEELIDIKDNIEDIIKKGV